MEQKVKTSVIRQITPNGTWTAPDGKTLYKFDVMTDDGITGGMMAARSEMSFKVGDEVKLEVKETTATNGNVYTNYKIYKEPGQSGGGRSGGYQPNPERDAQIARMNCVTNAMALVNAGAVSPTKVLHIADQLYTYIQTGTNRDLLLEL